MSQEIKITKKQRKDGFMKGFKNFIMRGNVIDMAVGVIVGGAFGKIVTSLVNDIILPPIGVLLGGVEFRELQLLIKSTPILDDMGNQVVIDGISQFTNVYIRYGNLIQIIIEFLIIAFTIYLVLYIFIKRKEMEQKLIKEEKERLEKLELEKNPPKPEPVVIPEDILLLTEIRDLLKKNDK
ncbi:large conductance mechanosensitive channel protein MscL [Acholeplasma granularum]|uniref:large conductance mechanosensitive channel protein MscL n=1 Tax=Acholeplasma granularum TaxID=264635 RepID=UPI00046E9E57|nr:large conductance mechanosensitive channel protein MscL [Acholeplasma granularum]